MQDDNFWGFRYKAERAKRKGTSLKFLRYGKNLRYNSEEIYCYNTKIANLDFNNRTMERIGYWCPTISKHYNYAAMILDDTYGFHEVEPAQTGPHVPLIHAQDLSYGDHA